MKKIYLAVFIIAIFLIFIFVFLRIGFDKQREDSWIKNSQGIYIKHGNPSVIPDKFKEQQSAISCSENLYQQEKNKGVEFNSQCLGTCENYAVDIVHVPRIEEDNLIENQCEDFRNRNIKNFIELDKDGNVVKIED